VIIGKTDREVSSLIDKYRSSGVTEQLENNVIYGTPEQLAAKIQDRIQAGVQYLIVNFKTPHEKDALKLFTERVMPQFK
jgi:alkanesulfonate monooxygenase SsuD/methylene tetrahydromethanopterin reductase-like flavin-dependent oxidoreductase (luciferase family)